ncbi:hypothetical protein ACFOY8_14480 [Thalassospira xianhensis]|uniref:hypothetical protein n=1 Tax=Thalassospira xianhensis TaxID=478503 RepID=UPI0011BE0874|nr:hypothetical protein [Thalassospira xianhensis]
MASLGSKTSWKAKDLYGFISLVDEICWAVDRVPTPVMCFLFAGMFAGISMSIGYDVINPEPQENRPEMTRLVEECKTQAVKENVAEDAARDPDFVVIQGDLNRSLSQRKKDRLSFH